MKAVNKNCVELDKNEQLEVVEEYLSNLFNIPKDCFLDNNNIVYWEEQNMGTHSDAEKKIFRKATLEDKIYFKFLEILYNKL